MRELLANSAGHKVALVLVAVFVFMALRNWRMERQKLKERSEEGDHIVLGMLLSVCAALYAGEQKWACLTVVCGLLIILFQMIDWAAQQKRQVEASESPS
ncbi:MAG: hypothetical protein JWL87_757 [Candidatus Adlerbacteria bacterium]|nr:hypothetical protein [Candidatus Adlerbacteria bacterium]